MRSISGGQGPEPRAEAGDGNRRSLNLLLFTFLLLPMGCGDGGWVAVPGSEGALKSSAAIRAERRLYDGAPPVIGHGDFGADCAACHAVGGIFVPGVGVAPPSPHEGTANVGATERCRQCHVFAKINNLFVKSDFVGFRQDMRPGGRLYPGAPPTIPHKTFMRENCGACHTGPAARAEIVTSHPERTRCRQCHVPVTTREGALLYPATGPETSEDS